MAVAIIINLQIQQCEVLMIFFYISLKTNCFTLNGRHLNVEVCLMKALLALKCRLLRDRSNIVLNCVIVEVFCFKLQSIHETIVFCPCYFLT